MSTTFQAKYEIADGYSGGYRPQTFKIDERDFEDNDDEVYLREFYQESIQFHFGQNIVPEASGEDEFVKWAQQKIAEGNQS